MAWLTLFDHAHNQALLETTELAAISPPLINWTVFVGEAHIFSIFLYCSLKRENKKMFMMLHYEVVVMQVVF